MSDTNEYSKVVNKLTTFRSLSGALADSQMALVKKILDHVQGIYDKQLNNLSPQEQGRLEFYQYILDDLKKCLEATQSYNNSLERDYAEAMKLLAKLHGGSKNG